MKEDHGLKMAIFPKKDDDPEVMTVHGALVQGQDFRPARQGVLIYFNAGRDLSTALDKVEGAGGKVLEKKKNIGEHGYIAIFEDCEGYRLAMHSPE